MPAIRLLVADDHPVVRDCLSSLFAREPGFEVVGEAADGAEALRLGAAVTEAFHRGLLRPHQ